jgi:Ni,Fe-hydrogenase I cytochrome b subunit
MTKTDAILHKGQKLYEDDAYILLWTKFLGLSLLALTSYYVYDKQKQRLIKLISKEKTYLMSISYYLTHDYGFSPKMVLEGISLFKDFSTAIADRGGETWKTFFAETAKDKARTYAVRGIRKDKKAKN